MITPKKILDNLSLAFYIGFNCVLFNLSINPAGSQGFISLIKSNNIAKKKHLIFVPKRFIEKQQLKLIHF